MALADQTRRRIQIAIELRLQNETEEEINKVLNHLTESSESRYKSCMESVDRSEQYLLWLNSSRESGLASEALNKHGQFLTLKKKLCLEKTIEFSRVGKELGGDICDETLIEQDSPFIKLYIDAALGQMLVQKQLYQKEIELSNNFSLFAQSLFSKFARSVSINRENIILLAKTLKILKNGEIQPDELKNFQYHELMKNLEIFKEQLNLRQAKLELIEKVVKVIKKVLMQKDNKNVENENVESSEKNKPGNGRMVFASKNQKNRV